MNENKIAAQTPRFGLTFRDVNPDNYQRSSDQETTSSP